MIVIVEGLDGVGKTTICKLFSEQTGFRYVHESYTDNSDVKEERYYTFLKRLNSDQNYIYDRITIIDDFVYSFLNKTRSTLTVYERGIVKALQQAKIFHFELDEQTRIQRFIERGDEFVTNDMMDQIAENYEQFYKKIPGKVIYFTLSEDNEQNVKQMRRRLKI